MNEDLIREARRYSKARSKKVLTEEVLQTLVQVKSEEARMLDYRARVQRLDETFSGVVLRESPHSILRSDRERQ